jgi:hypothetical protein
MLLAGVTEIGVAVARAPNAHPKFISVQLLGRPEALKVKFAIENRAGSDVPYTLGEKEHTLPSHTIVTHTACDAGQLSFDKAGAALRFDPRDGARFVVRAGKGGSVEVTADRK